jgi:Ca2+/Na+ antiporter
MTTSIRAMKWIVWAVLLLGIVYTLDVAKNLDFNWGEVFGSITVIPVITIVLPIIILLFTRKKSVADEKNNKINARVLMSYLLIVIALIAFLYYTGGVKIFL